MRLCDLDEIKVCVDRQYENCHGYSGSKKAIYREAILAVKSILHSAKSIDGVTVQEWISVKDRLPEEKGRYLTANKRFGDKIVVFDLWFGGGFWYVEEEDDVFDFEVTHWMPLPNPPKGE